MHPFSVQRFNLQRYWQTGRSRRRLSAVALIGLAAVVVFLVKGILLRPQDPTWVRIQREGVLRVGLDPSFPPFEVDRAGEIVGYDVDLAHMLAERWGVAVQLIPISFDGLIDGLLTEQYDVIISAFPYDPHLTRDVAYSEAYFNAGQVLVVRNGPSEPPIGAAQDLVGRRLAVEWGSSGDVEARRLAKRIAGLQVVPFDTPQAALDGMRAGRADAALVDAVSAYGYLGHTDGARVVGKPLTDERYIIVVRPDSRQLLEAINVALAAFRQGDVFSHLQQKWFGQLPEE